MPKQPDLIAEFEAAYNNVLADAERAAETTSTDAWHTMYQEFQENAKQQAIDIARELDVVVANTRAMLINTDVLQLLGEQKKKFGELRDRVESFKLSTVNPIKKPFDKANELIAAYQGKAAAAADAEGMYDKDIEDQMADAIATKAKVRWNEKVGSIQIVAATKPA